MECEYKSLRKGSKFKVKGLEYRYSHSRSQTNNNETKHPEIMK